MTDDSGLPEGADEYPPTPFSFKFMIGLAVLYLGWRLIQGLVWLWERIF
jgi:hypothetical protein